MSARKVQINGGESAARAQVALPLIPSGVCSLPDHQVSKQIFSAEHERSTKAAVANNRLVGRLAGSALFSEFQRAFEDATGLPLTLRAVEGFQLAHAGSRRQNGFCAMMSRTNHSCAACLQVQQRVCEGVKGAPCTMSCTFGLTETAVGVKVGADVIAYLQTGQVFFKPPTACQTQRALQQIKEWGLRLDEDEAERRYRETPVIRQREYEATVQLLQFFADQLGIQASQIVMQQQTAEPGPITRARKFIADQYQGKLSLTAVAREAGMGTFHFCKTFTRVTGVNFMQYLAHVRVEKAKNLLLNSNYRISDIALEVGFQSGGHFGRTFKRIAHQSPMEYRQQLPAA